MSDEAIKALMVAQDAMQEVLAENVRLRKALVELDTGGGNYMTARRDIAQLSGVPAMAITWDEHIKAIKGKLP